MDENEQFDSDESDEDFVPEKCSDVSQSEEDSETAGSSDDKADDDEQTATKQSKSKRKRRKGKLQSRKEVPNTKKPPAVEKNESETAGLGEASDEQKRADDLWASFLSDSKENESKASASKSAEATVHEDEVVVTEICDFAGEQVVVSKKVNVSKDTKDINKASSTSKDTTLKKSPALLGIAGIQKDPHKRPATGGGGLGSILGQIGKKNKITVLEKTKLDWDKFKDNEGLGEELKTYNKGKGGFLERRDFLERTDLRQFEIERNLRQKSKRSNP